MNVILTGMPASGKTTVSKILGKILNAKVVDTDEIIVKKHGAISDIFAKYGEEYFRNLETEAVKEVCALNGAVVSTGGGCLLKEENVNLFKGSGRIIYLKADVKTLLSRVGNDTSRPLLVGDAKKKLMELYSERSPIYENAADFTIVTDGISPEEVAAKIAELLK